MQKKLHVFEAYSFLDDAKRINSDFELVIWTRQKLIDLMKKIESELKSPVEIFDKVGELNETIETLQNLGRVAVLYTEGGVFLSQTARPQRNLNELVSKFQKEQRIVVSESYRQNTVSYLQKGDSNMTSKMLSANVLISNPRTQAVLSLLKGLILKVSQYEKYKLRISAKDLRTATGDSFLNLAYRLSPKDFLVLESYVLDNKDRDNGYVGNTSYDASLWELWYSPVVYICVFLVVAFVLYRLNGPEIVLLFVASFLTSSLTFFSYAVHGGYVSDNFRDPLPDKLFDFVEYRDVGSLFFLIDALPSALVVAFVVITVAAKRPDTQKLLVSIIAGLLIMWNFKISSVQLTGVPVPKISPPYLTNTEIMSQEFWKHNASSTVFGNADMMFSGHTCSAVFALLMILWVSKASIASRVLAFAAFLAFAYGLLVIRFHYSMDIMVGAIVGVLVFLVAKGWIVSVSGFFYSEFANLLFLSIGTSLFSTTVSVAKYFADSTKKNLGQVQK